MTLLVGALLYQPHPRPLAVGELDASLGYARQDQLGGTAR